MGGTYYSDAVHTARMTRHDDDGTSIFTHDDAIRSGKTKAAVHALLDPSKANKAGLIIRESRDSDAHPLSRAVAVLFDETGSMRNVPSLFVRKLGKLMATLVGKGFLQHPHVLFGAFGDATCDRVPLQVGQFEGGNEMDEALSKIFLEGNGGGQDTESYELAMYFMARHTSMDCLEKRGEKGYLFLSGDEHPYERVKRSEVKEYIGDDLEADIPLEKILAELREKFEVYWLFPKQGSYTNNKPHIDYLRDMFGQNLIMLEDANDACEVIASIIGLAEGYDIKSVGGALKDLGTDDAVIGRTITAVAKFAGKSGLAKVAEVKGDLAKADTSADSVARP